MPAPLPPFIALRALEAAARLKSYSRAAQELNVTHGAVSQQIRRLEEVYGGRLFHRRANAMIPTDAALKLAGRVQQAMRLLELGAQELFNDGGRASLVISAVPSFVSRWLSSRLAGFHTHAPDIRIEIRAEMRVADFGSDGVDLAIRYGAGVWDGLSARPLFRDRLIPVCCSSFLHSHPLATLSDLAKAPLLRMRRRSWKGWFARLGLAVEEPTGGLVFDDGAFVLDAAARGEGVALALSSLAQHDLASGRLVRASPHAVETDDSYFLVWREDSPKSATITRFQSWILSEAAQSQTEDIVTPG